MTNDSFFYPNDFSPSITIEQLLLKDTDTSETVTGRVIAKRHMGNITFLSVQENGYSIQVILSSSNTADYTDVLTSIQIGYICGFTGYKSFNKNSSAIFQATSSIVLSLCMHKLPSKFYGLKDPEIRNRKRYLDMIVNADHMNIIKIRAQALSTIRYFLDNKGFIEVDTPVLHPVYGGAEAEPFTTYHNSSKSTAYLRIAPELYLKRLLVGGLRKVYEIGKNFRNEGISVHHNPEFTAIEWYESYADYRDAMALTQNLLREVTAAVKQVGENISDIFNEEFAEVHMEESVSLLVGKDNLSRDGLLQFCHERTFTTVDINSTYEELITEVFDLCVAPGLIRPTFVTGYFSSLSPLARPCSNNPFYCDRWELYAVGMEIANSYSELNDPMIQRRNMKPLDEDYIEALEYGMPPAAGVGIGIDRLIKILAQAHSIREVITFPHMKAVTS